MSDIAFRAAKYFGVEREPRTSIPITRRRVLVVAARGGGTALMDYSEELAEPTGSYAWLGPRTRKALVGALAPERESGSEA